MSYLNTILSYPKMDNPRKIFTQIYDNYVDKIYRFIYFKVNSEEIAQDLCSETFLRGWQSFKENKQEIENPQAFLYQIARNLVIDHYREKGRTQTVSADYVSITDPGQNLEEQALSRSDLDTIKLALTDLKDNYQELVVWHYIDDLSISEISKLLNKSEGAVRVMLHRALKSLRNNLKET